MKFGVKVMLGNVGWAQLLIVLVIIILLFGTKKLRGIGGDLGGAYANKYYIG